MSRTVLIGIQARSGSTRLPRKAFELIAGKMMLDRVIEACKKAVPMINGASGHDLKCKVAVLTPEGDPIAREFRSRCDVFEGPETDVLARYALAAKHYGPELIVRVTGDCPLLPPYTIAKMVALANNRSYDYVSNVDDRFRTAIDGSDCEVMTRELLSEVDRMADSASDREHVTTWVRRSPPDWAKIGCVVNHFDHSDQKLSVDDAADLARVRQAFERANDKYSRAVLQYGQTQVHYI